MKVYVRDAPEKEIAPADRAMETDLDGPATEIAPEMATGRDVQEIVQVDLEVGPTGIGLTIGPVIGRTGINGIGGIGAIGRTSIVNGITTGIRITSIGSTTTGGLDIPKFVGPTT